MRRWFRQIADAAALGALLATAAVAAGCGPECATDDDCGDGALCVNGQCVQRALPATDATLARDAAGPDRTPADSGRGDNATASDHRLTDTTTIADARHDGGGPRDAAAVDTRRDGSAQRDSASALDARRDGAAAGDAAGADVNSYPGQVGAPCQGSGECTSPVGATCDLSMPGGYCTAGCTYGGSALQCGSHAECYCTSYVGGDCLDAQCFRTCWFYNECRDGYVCETADWLGFEGSEDLCYPQ